MTEGTGRSVAIVDDDADVRDTLQLLFRLHGYVAIAFASARDALEWLRAGGRPDLIVLDLMMPGMNGVEFRRAQLQDRELADIPVVVLTGARRIDDDDGVLNRVEVLEKPIAKRELLGVLERYCGPG